MAGLTKDSNAIANAAAQTNWDVVQYGVAGSLAFSDASLSMANGSSSTDKCLPLISQDWKEPGTGINQGKMLNMGVQMVFDCLPSLPWLELHFEAPLHSKLFAASALVLKSSQKSILCTSGADLHIQGIRYLSSAGEDKDILLPYMTTNGTTQLDCPRSATSCAYPFEPPLMATEIFLNVTCRKKNNKQITNAFAQQPVKLQLGM